MSGPCPSPLAEAGWLLLLQVMEASVPGARMLVADCPNRGFLPALLRSKVLHGSISAEEAEKRAANSTEGAIDRSENRSSSKDIDSHRSSIVVHLAPVKVPRLLAAWRSCNSRC